MAWDNIKLKIQGKELLAQYETDEGKILMPYVKGLGDSLSINGKEHKILESVHVEMDNVLRLKLAMASKEKGEKSDGKSVKRSD